VENKKLSEKKIYFGDTKISSAERSRILNGPSFELTPEKMVELGKLAKEAYANIAQWYPMTNQLAGQCLCEFAARFLGEDPSAYPWEATQ